MTVWDCIQRTDITQDQFLAVSVKPNIVVDEKQMAIQNANTTVMLGCIRDRYTANMLLYDTRNHVTMRQFLCSVSFDVEDFRMLLIQLMESIDVFSKIKLSQTNILFSLDQIYVDVVNKKLKFVYLPAHTSISINDAMQKLSDMLREMTQIARVTDGHTLFGLILMHTNAEKFNAVNFYRDISDYQFVMQKRSHRAISRVMLAYILTVVIIAIAVLGVPLWGLLTKSYQLTQFIDMETLFFEALLLLAGAIVSCVIIIPLREIRKIKRKSTGPMSKAGKAKKMNKKQKQMLEKSLTSGEITAPEPIAAEADAAKTMIMEPSLINKNGNAVSINSSEFTVGREGSSASFCVGDSAVSADHAAIIKTQDKYYIRDNGSRNGTFHNGTRLNPNEPSLLRDGDKIKFADEEFTFSL